MGYIAVRIILIWFIHIIFLSPTFGKNYFIIGSTNFSEGKFFIYSEANPFIIETDITEEGTFYIDGNTTLPTQMVATVKSGELTSIYEFFLINKIADTILIYIHLEEREISWKIKGPEILSVTGYEQIPKLQKQYFAELSTTENDTFILNKFEKELQGLLGNDELGSVISKCVKLNAMSILVTPKMERLYNIYLLPEFNKLPKNCSKFSGFSYYIDIMVGYNFFIIEDSLRLAKNNPNYHPSYTEWQEAVSLRRSSLPLSIYLFMSYKNFFTYKEGTSFPSKEHYLKDVDDFINQYPNYKRISGLRKKYQQIKFSFIDQKLPVCELMDQNGEKHQFPFQNYNMYILLDVWGSWCAPCRSLNKEWVGVYYELQKRGVQIISIAHDVDQKAWKEAINEDGMTWPQYLATPEFLDKYQIITYPTMFLISPDGVLIKKESFKPNKIEDIFQYLKK